MDNARHQSRADVMFMAYMWIYYDRSTYSHMWIYYDSWPRHGC